MKNRKRIIGVTYNEWISRMAAALSHNDDYIVLGELYSIKKELDNEDAREKEHWSSRY